MKQMTHLSFEAAAGRQSRCHRRGKLQLHTYMKLLTSHKPAMLLALQDDNINKLAFAKLDQQKNLVNVFLSFPQRTHIVS